MGVLDQLRHPLMGHVAERQLHIHLTRIQLTLFGEGAGISIHTGPGQDNATDLFWGLEEALWNSGDRVVLYDDAGTVQAEFQVP